MIKRFFHIALLLLSLTAPAGCVSQNREARSRETLRQREQQLVTLYEKIKETSYNSGDTKETLLASFEKELRETLELSGSFSYSFETLQQHISIALSGDAKLKAWSWSEDESGNTEYFKTFLRGENTPLLTLSTDARLTDLFSMNTSHYVLAAYKADAGGLMRLELRLVEITGKKLREKKITGKAATLQIHYPRNQKIELTYNPKAKSISFNEYIQDEDTGFYTPTGNRITYTFLKNKLLKL